MCRGAVPAAIGIESVAALPGSHSPEGTASPRRACCVGRALRQSQRVRYRGLHRVARRLAIVGVVVAAFAFAAPPALAAPKCGAEWASDAGVGRPSARLAWRAKLLSRTPPWSSGPGRHRKSRGSVVPRGPPRLVRVRAPPGSLGRRWAGPPPPPPPPPP